MYPIVNCIKAAERNNRGSSDGLVVRSSKMGIPSHFQAFLSNNNNKERLCQTIDNKITRLLSHNNTSIEVIVETFTVNHGEANTKLVCLVKHAIEHEGNSEDAISIIRSALGDIVIPVILVNAETNSNIFIDNGTRNNRKLYVLMLQL